MTTPFYEWSIANAWEWFVHVPFLGFIGMIVVAILLFIAFAIVVDP